MKVGVPLLEILPKKVLQYPVIWGKFKVDCLRAGVGEGFTNIHELHVIKYKEAMETKDKEIWTQAVHKKFNNVYCMVYLR